tara:strand:+ start:547 stop:1161 length:615 start_codon:yes stop_codon:yes gene_type:complete
MTIILFSQIVIVCLLGAMSPGPSMVVVLNNAIFKNKFNGILTALGHGVGIGIYAICAVIGIGLILKTNLFLFNLLKVFSIIFLLYLGVKAIYIKGNLDFSQNSIKSGSKSFIQGLSISILNPKIFIWFLAIYSQFMSVNNDFILNLFLVLIASTVDALWYILLVIIVTSKSVIEFIKDKYLLAQRIIGIFFIIIALVLIIELFV